MEAYSHLSKMYDYLMDDVDYDHWVQYLDLFITNNYSNAESVLELACGTGNITSLLAQKNYRIDAVDLSEEMLTVAQEKLKNNMGKVRFIHSDMLELDLNKKYDVILCLCDGVNYITDLEDIDHLFGNVYDLLNENGLFIFDISSEYKLAKVLGNNTYAENFDDFSYIWENFYDEESRMLEFDFTIFLEENGLFRKFHEYHNQRAHRVDELCQILKAKGFETLGVFDEMTEDKYKENSERIHFVLKK